MNEIVKKLLLAGNKFLPDMHLRQLGLTKKVDLGNLQKESENLNKQEIQDIFIKVNYIKFVFHMTWLMEILKI